MKIFKRKRLKTKKSVFKKYDKLWRQKLDFNYLNYVSDFGTIVAVNGGYLLFLNNENANELDVKGNKQKIKAIEHLIYHYQNKLISLPQMLTLMKTALQTF